MSRGIRANVAMLCSGVASFVLIVCWCRPSVLAAQALQLQFSPQDTSLNLDTLNYSRQPVLTTSTSPDSGPASVILMKFDLSDVPAGARVQKATLQLTLIESDAAADSTYTITAHKVVGRSPMVPAATGQTADGVAGWTPNDCCANNIPLAQADISAPYDTRAIDKTPGGKSWTITAMMQEWLADPATNSGLVLNPDSSTPRDRFRYFASAEHADPRLRPVLRITYSSPSGDVTPPSVQLTAPASGATVARSISLSATASDDMAVTGVQFQLDGTPIGPEVTALPYVLDWDTSAASDGRHSFTATARDAAGNSASSAGVLVNIVNGILRLAPEDTSLSLDSVNYSRQQRLTAYIWPDHRIGSAILLKFDLRTVPRGAVIQEAKLKLALLESDTAQEPTFTVTAHKVGGKNPEIATATGYRAGTAAEWTPNTCCANNVPMAQADVSTPYDTQAVDRAPGFKSWTITALVQEWLADPSTNVGVLLNPDSSKPRDRYRYFASMEHPDQNLHPFLELTYLPPQTAGPTLPPLPDLLGPTVSMTAPTEGATLSGTVGVSADAIDILGVAGVQFKLDGVDLGAEDTTPPYSVSWTTGSSTNGSHALMAVARNIAGLVGASAAVSVTVANDTTPVVLSGVTASAITSSGATISWTTNEPSDSLVEYGATTAYGNSSGLDARPVTAHSMTLSGLAAGTPYHYRVASKDAAGNPAISVDFTFTTLAAVDVTPPSVSLTAPVEGASVSGTFAVSAIASDDVGVAGVQFKLDGAGLGPEDTATPFSISWDTTTASNGIHTLTAVARDSAGNSTTSASVSVTVANGTVVLSPQDTSLNLNTINYSSDTMLKTYTWPDNKVANTILMTFDLSSVPAGAVVQQATLQLALVEADTAAEPTYTVGAHKVVNKNPVIASATGYTADGVTPWTPNACCSNGVPLAQADISAPYDTQAIDKGIGFKSWTITGMVQEWLADPASNLGLLLNSDASKLRDRYRYFASMEHPDPSLRPSLRVAYTLVPDTTPPVMSAVTSSAITASGATITWLTNEASDSQVEYGTTTAYGTLTTLNTSRVTSHTVTLSGLAANTLYHFRVRSRDVAGNLAESADAVLTTLAEEPPPPPGGGPNEPPGFTRFAEYAATAAPLNGPTGSQSACSTSGVLEGCWWKFSANPLNLSGAVDAAAPESPSGVFQFRYPAGQPPGNQVGLLQGWDTPSETTNTEYREIYESGWVRTTGPTFENQAIGTKMLGYWGVGQSGSGTLPTQIYEISIGSGSTAPMSSWKIRFAQQGPIARNLPQTAGGAVWTAGEWHHYEIYMKLNSVNLADGVLRVWWNGTLVMDYNDVQFRNAANPSGFYGRRLDPVWGGIGGTPKTRDDFLQFDHIYLSGVPLNVPASSPLAGDWPHEPQS